MQNEKNKGFTLIELLIVVVVIAILSSIAFKISNIGSDSTRRNLTVERIQKLENALSGYYAAFGSYPPVQLEGRSRNFYFRVNGYGIQQVTRNPESSINLQTSEGWQQVDAACRAQPVAMEFPYGSGYQDYVKAISTALKDRYNAGEDEFKDNPALAFGFDGLRTAGQLSSKKDKGDWSHTQLFKFGLMSYLLPRYLIMIDHSKNTGDRTDLYDDFAQWMDNNEIPCRFEDGVPYNNWKDMQHDIANESERWKVSLLPSQTVTARWIVNFQNSLSCCTSESYYGVDLKSYRSEDVRGTLSAKNPRPKLYSAADSQSGQGTSGSQQYVLNAITMNDGWGNELYYYSLPPYQKYRIWSAGPNGRTFPPWVSPEELRTGALSGHQKLINQWVGDDIVQMSN